MKYNQNNFQNDYFDGYMFGEVPAADILQSHGYKTESTAKDGKNSSHDILVTHPDGRQRLIEVKFDRKSKDTQNVAVEIGRDIGRGKTKDSGLTVTQSDYYCFVLPQNPTIYFIPTKELKALVNGYRKVKNNDKYQPAIIALIPVNVIVANSKKATKKTNKKTTGIQFPD